MALYHYGRLFLLLVTLSILNALIRYYPVLLGSQHLANVTAQKLPYILPLCVSVLMPVRMVCFYGHGSSGHSTTVFCVTNGYVVCVSETSSTLVIPSSWATVFSVYFVSHHSGQLKGLSLSALALFCHTNWPWKDQTLLLSHSYFWLLVIILYSHCFSHLLSFQPLLRDWHT